MHKVELTDGAFEEFQELRKSDKNDYTKCFDLLLAIAKMPRDGIGHPERLKYQENEEVWSRKINKKDRLTYVINDTENVVVVLSCHGHYDDK